MVVFAPRALCNILYDLGYAMIQDDRKDIGKVIGGGHTFIHHYQCGTFLMLLGGLGKYVEKGKQQALTSLRVKNPYVRHNEAQR
jgi:hypothetical protein